MQKSVQITNLLTKKAWILGSELAIENFKTRKQEHLH